MRDNALVNFSGLEGHSMPIDLNIEHLIKFLKVLFNLGLSLLLVLVLITMKAIFCSEGDLFYVGSSWRHFRNCQPSSRRQKASRMRTWDCL
jgi:hypothetical protein